MTEQCIKHEYTTVNNRYDQKGEPVIEGGEWRTERICAKCDEKFELPEYLVNNYERNKI